MNQEKLDGLFLRNPATPPDDQTVHEKTENISIFRPYLSLKRLVVIRCDHWFILAHV